MLVRAFCINIGTSTVPDGLAACQALSWNMLQSHSAALQVYDRINLHNKLPQAPATHASPSLSCRTSVISMSLKTGIVGLPNVGKVRDLLQRSGVHATEPATSNMSMRTLCSSSTTGRKHAAQSTLFNAICENGKAQAANFPFCTIEPNVGIVAVPDPRLQVRLVSGPRALILSRIPCCSMSPNPNVQHIKPTNVQIMAEVPVQKEPRW